MPNRDLSSAELYGKGIFATVAIAAREPFLWEAHWRRLSANAASIGMEFSDQTYDATLDILKNKIVKSGLKNGRARVTISDESPSLIWASTDREKKTKLSIIVAERRPIPDNFKLTTSPYRVNTTSPLVGIKSCNYLDHLLAYEEATRRGFHEAIRLNERGEVASACMANVFWEKDGKLYTPGLQTGCLPGTTRAYILENVDCEQVAAGLEEIENAESIFLTSAGLGVVAVAEFDGRKLDTSSHGITELISWGD